MQVSSDTMQQLLMAEKTVKLMWSAYCQMMWSSVDDGGENHFSILYDLFLPTYRDITQKWCIEKHISNLQ